MAQAATKPHFALAQAALPKYKQDLGSTRRKTQQGRKSSQAASLAIIESDQLLARIAAHDVAAMTALFDQWAPALRGMIQRLIPSPEEAEIVLENLFLRLWKGNARELRAGAGHAGMSLEAWLFISARRDAGARRRQALGQSRLHLSQGFTPRWLPQAREIGLLSSRLDLIVRALAQMPKAQRQILDLVLYEGLTEIEAAEALREPPGKIRDHVRAALSFVRQRLRTLMGTWTADI